MTVCLGLIELVFACESKACAVEIRDTEGRGLNQEQYRGEVTEIRSDTEGRGLNQERYRGEGTESGAIQMGGD